MTQGKTERWHRLVKNQVLLENYFLPGDLKARISEFVNYYNAERNHKSVNNLTPEDVYTDREAPGSPAIDQRYGYGDEVIHGCAAHAPLRGENLRSRKRNTCRKNGHYRDLIANARKAEQSLRDQHAEGKRNYRHGHDAHRKN
jgi:transposase InsO family protein